MNILHSHFFFKQIKITKRKQGLSIYSSLSLSEYSDDDADDDEYDDDDELQESTEAEAALMVMGCTIGQMSSPSSHSSFRKRTLSTSKKAQLILFCSYF